MWFAVLSLIIGVALMIKAGIALAAPQRFYAVRQRQFASDVLSRKLLIAPAMVIALALGAWYATIFHYRPWGWVVTGFLTALSCMSGDHVFRWSKHRQAMMKAVTSPKVWWFDWFLLAFGAGFVALARFVY
jgi:hypothetical protein